MEKYEKIKKIGRGTYGDVILVRRKEDNEMLALKKVQFDCM
jgi:serine/threonine protein kinase